MKRTRGYLDKSAARLDAVTGGDYPLEYYNKPEVIAAEAQGLSVPDAMLGWVLNHAPDDDRRALTLNIAESVAAELRTREVASKCHNVHAILSDLLTLAGIPSVSLWGSLNAEAPAEYLSFTLSPYVGAAFEGFRPGHSWLITPEFRVLDVALKHQADVEGGYDLLQARIPTVLSTERAANSPPEDKWIAPYGRTKLTEFERSDASEYLEVLGWNEIRTEELVFRYVPSAVQVPDSDWNFATALPPIGGMNPLRFFRKRIKPLLRESASDAG